MDVREKQSSEKRLIDANVLISYIDECSQESRFRVYYGYAKSFIDDAPTVDAVEVVRCRDCKFGSWDSEPDDAMVCMRTKDGFWRSGNDFCSRGERNEYNRRAGEEGKHEAL